jgi:hypothetical protein
VYVCDLCVCVVYVCVYVCVCVCVCVCVYLSVRDYIMECFKGDRNM